MMLNLAALDGLRIPGGCEHCNAYQTIHANEFGANAHRLAIHHDNWCPWLTAHTNKAAHRAAQQKKQP